MTHNPWVPRRLDPRRPRVLYFPNWMAVVTALGVAPLIAIMAVGYSILCSARVSDVRTAQQLGSLGSLAALPGAGLYIALLAGAFSLDLASLAVMCVIFAAVDIALAFAARAAFNREKILTRWA